MIRKRSSAQAKSHSGPNLRLSLDSSTCDGALSGKRMKSDEIGLGSDWAKLLLICRLQSIIRNGQAQ